MPIPEHTFSQMQHYNIMIPQEGKKIQMQEENQINKAFLKLPQESTQCTSHC